ncbi:unnamed protein product, partial [Amoebophrya sp. A25]
QPNIRRGKLVQPLSGVLETLIASRVSIRVPFSTVPVVPQLPRTSGPTTKTPALVSQATLGLLASSTSLSPRAEPEEGYINAASSTTTLQQHVVTVSCPTDDPSSASVRHTETSFGTVAKASSRQIRTSHNNINKRSEAELLQHRVNEEQVKIEEPRGGDENKISNKVTTKISSSNQDQVEQDGLSTRNKSQLQSHDQGGTALVEQKMKVEPGKLNRDDNAAIEKAVRGPTAVNGKAAASIETTCSTNVEGCNPEAASRPLSNVTTSTLVTTTTENTSSTRRVPESAFPDSGMTQSQKPFQPAPPVTTTTLSVGATTSTPRTAPVEELEKESAHTTSGVDLVSIKSSTRTPRNDAEVEIGAATSSDTCFPRQNRAQDEAYVVNAMSCKSTSGSRALLSDEAVNGSTTQTPSSRTKLSASAGHQGDTLDEEVEDSDQDDLQSVDNWENEPSSRSISPMRNNTYTKQVGVLPAPARQHHSVEQLLEEVDDAVLGGIVSGGSTRTTTRGQLQGGGHLQLQMKENKASTTGGVLKIPAASSSLNRLRLFPAPPPPQSTLLRSMPEINMKFAPRQRGAQGGSKPPLAEQVLRTAVTAAETAAPASMPLASTSGLASTAIRSAVSSTFSTTE